MTPELHEILLRLACFLLGLFGAWGLINVVEPYRTKRLRELLKSTEGTLAGVRADFERERAEWAEERRALYENLGMALTTRWV